MPSPNLLLLVAVAVAVGVAAAANVGDPRPPHGHSAPIPNFVVDLGVAPMQRWTAIVTPYTADIADLINTVMKVVPKKLLPDVEALATDLDKYVHAPYADELRGVAAATGLNLGEVLLMNMFYELTAACTSVVAQTANGTMLHARNLDYDLPAMQRLAITVDFQSGGVTQYRAVTFAGYIGILTGVRPGAFSLSVDERNLANTTVWANAMEALFHGGRSLALALREIADTTSTFQDALQQLTTMHLIADSYVIIAGAKAGEGAVVTRDRDHAADVWLLNYPSRWFLVETNYDHWNPPPTHDDRRDPANSMMNATTPAAITPQYMVGTVLGTFPVLNSMTVYTAFMCAASGDLSAVTQNNV